MCHGITAPPAGTPARRTARRVDGPPAPPGREPPDDRPGRRRRGRGQPAARRRRVVRPGRRGGLASTGTVAGGFLVNGRHLSFGDDPSREMWVGGQLFNLNKYNAVPPRSVKVWLEYGRDRSYGQPSRRRSASCSPTCRSGTASRACSRRRGRSTPTSSSCTRSCPAWSRAPSTTTGSGTPRAARPARPRRDVQHRARRDLRAVHVHRVRRRGDPRAVARPRPVAAAGVGLGRVEQRVVRFRPTRITRSRTKVNTTNAVIREITKVEEPDQRHPVPVQPAGRGPVLRAGAG